MAANKKADPDHADERPARAARIPARITDARFLAGVFVDADGVPLTDADSRLAHQARDAAALAERIAIQDEATA